MKTSILTLVGLLSVASAFAAPNYICEPNDKESGLNSIIIGSPERGSVHLGTMVEGQPVAWQNLKEQDADGTPEGYTRFFLRGGCNQNGNGPHCFAIWYETLMVSDELLSGSMNGSVILNNQDYSCQMELMWRSKGDVVNQLQ